MKTEELQSQQAISELVEIPAGEAKLPGELKAPESAKGVVLFAHGSGSGRRSPRNQFVAQGLRERGLATLLFDLLTEEEGKEDDWHAHLRFDIEFLSRRLMDAARWAARHPATQYLGLGFFGASTGAAAALTAAAELGSVVDAVVSRGGRPDLAGKSLSRVESPSLLIVGERDEQVLALNQDAYNQMSCEKELRIARGATHLFEEPGALEEVAEWAAEWFERHLAPR